MIGRNEFNGLGAATKCRHETLPGGSAHFEFILNLNRTWRDNGGNLKDESCAIKCECFSKIAEVCERNVDNGTIVMVDGYLRNSETGVSIFVTRFWSLLNRKAISLDNRRYDDSEEVYENNTVEVDRR